MIWTQSAIRRFTICAISSHTKTFDCTVAKYQLIFLENRYFNTFKIYKVTYLISDNWLAKILHLQINLSTIFHLLADYFEFSTSE